MAASRSLTGYPVGAAVGGSAAGQQFVPTTASLLKTTDYENQAASVPAHDVPQAVSNVRISTLSLQKLVADLTTKLLPVLRPLPAVGDAVKSATLASADAPLVNDLNDIDTALQDLHTTLMDLYTNIVL